MALRLRDLFADIVPDTQPISTLEKYFSKHQKPLYGYKANPGKRSLQNLPFFQTIGFL